MFRRAPVLRQREPAGVDPELGVVNDSGHPLVFYALDSTSTLRLGSTATTGGTGNPAFATLETGAATALTILALMLPLIAVALVIFLLVRTGRMALRGMKWLKRR